MLNAEFIAAPSGAAGSTRPTSSATISANAHGSCQRSRRSGAAFCGTAASQPRRRSSRRRRRERSGRRLPRATRRSNPSFSRGSANSRSAPPTYIHRSAVAERRRCRAAPRRGRGRGPACSGAKVGGVAAGRRDRRAAASAAACSPPGAASASPRRPRPPPARTTRRGRRRRWSSRRRARAPRARVIATGSGAAADSQRAACRQKNS